MDLKPLTRQWVIAIDCQAPILDTGDKKSLDLAGLVLHLHLRPDVAKGGRDIVDIVSEG